MNSMLRGTPCEEAIEFFESMIQRVENLEISNRYLVQENRQLHRERDAQESLIKVMRDEKRELKKQLRSKSS